MSAVDSRTGPDDGVVVADSSAALAEALRRLDVLQVVGVDVERADSERYWRSAALVQLGGDVGAALVDPLALEDLSPLGRWLSERITILHAMDNDLAPLAAIGAAPGHVEDTALAAAVLGLPTGLSDLLADQLGVELDADKQAMQRADWAARPLTPRMRAYAAGDVVHLPALWSALAAELRSTGRWSWYVEERTWMRAQPAAEERRSWARTRGVSRLDARARARARSLWEVRERLARDTDTAPGRILGDRLLVDLASQPARGPRELGQRGVRRASIRQFGAHLLEALQAPATPDATRRRRLSEEQRELVDRLRSARTARAEELGLDPGFLCPNRVLPAAVQAQPSSVAGLRAALDLRDWQWEQVAERFSQVLGLEPDPPPDPDAPDPEAPA